MGKIPARDCEPSRTEVSLIHTTPRRRTPAPQLPQSHRAGPFSSKLLLRASHDLGEPLPLLPPGVFELLTSLEVNFIAQLFNEGLERAVFGHLLKCRLQFLSLGLRNPLGSEERSPLRQPDIHSLSAP